MALRSFCSRLSPAQPDQQVSPMPVTVTCPSCGARLKAPDNAAGKKLACSQCRGPIAVPAAGQIAESPPSRTLAEPRASGRSPARRH